MLDQNIERAFKESACGEIEVAQAGVNRYIVHVPFTFTDGDHYVVLLKQEGASWVLSDEGHTFMHLSYTLTDMEFDEGHRRQIIDGVLGSVGIEDRSGELVLQIPPNRYGDALFSFIQAITKITDVTFLTRERVRTTFQEDFQKLLTEKAQEVGLQQPQFGYAHPIRDPERHYPVDARLNGKTTKQILVFGVGNDQQCRDATITLHQWEKWQEQFVSIAIFQDQPDINRFVLGRFSDVAGRQLSNLETARQRVASYFNEVIQ